MPVMTDVISAGATGKFGGRFQGKQHEYAPYNCMLTLLATSDKADTSVTLNVGGEVIVDDMVISNAGAPGRFPIVPDDVVVQCPILKGQRIIYDVRVVTTAATVKSIVRLDPV